MPSGKDKAFGKPPSALQVVRPSEGKAVTTKGA